MTFWAGKRVLVAGGGGFVGSHVVEYLRAHCGIPADAIRVPRSSQCDLRIFDHGRSAVEGIDVVLHLAARVGGLDYSRRHPATQYRDCSLIDLQLIEAARLAGVQRFVFVSSVTAYPRDAQSPFDEDQLFGHLPADSHLGYGYAKRNAALLAEIYHREFGMHAVSVLSTNAYGPRDNFDRATSHVIPATIRKCLEDAELVVWGSGQEEREFIYVEDLARAIVLAAERLTSGTMLNVSTGTGTKISDLVYTIARLTNFAGSVSFDTSKPSGDLRRSVSTARLATLLSFTPRFSIEAGLARTIEWYQGRR